MEGGDVYKRLADHLSKLGMGYPPSDALEEILRECFSPQEAELALALPTAVPPLKLTEVDEIARKVGLPKGELERILEDLARRGLLFSGRTEDGKRG
ncbi:MAG: hypothetical protein DRG31_07045, partial [Deltaproteobacteria bacterium]